MKRRKLDLRVAFIAILALYHFPETLSSDNSSDVYAVERNITFTKSRVRSLYLVEKYFNIILQDNAIRRVYLEVVQRLQVLIFLGLFGVQKSHQIEKWNRSN